MKKHIELLGILHIIYHSLGMIIFMAVLAIMEGNFIVPWRDIAVKEIAIIVRIYGLLTIGLSFLFLLISITGIIAGIGLLRVRPWGRILALIIGFIALMRIPFGTALGIYTIWALMNDETIKLFEAGKKSNVTQGN